MFSAISGDFIDEPARQEAPAISSEVAEQARAGDSQAFTTLFQTYNSQICTYLARLVGNDEVGRDLAQETFMRAWESLPAMDQPLHLSPGSIASQPIAPNHICDERGSFAGFPGKMRRRGHLCKARKNVPGRPNACSRLWRAYRHNVAPVYYYNSSVDSRSVRSRNCCISARKA